MTKEQITLLKSFTAVSQSFYLKKGTIGVLSADQSCCLFYDANDFTDFETAAPIYDVNEFLAVLDTFGAESEIITDQKFITIKNGNKKIRYMLSTESVIDVPTTLETKFVGFPQDIVFTLNKNDLEQIKKISSLLGLKDIKFSLKGKKVTIELNENDNQSSDSFKIELAGSGNEVVCSINTEEIKKIIPGDYDVTISSIGMSRFVSKNISSLRYFIANLA